MDSEFSPFDERAMRLALNEAEAAFGRGEIPVGAVITAGNRILAKGSNQTELLNDVTAHAEMIALSAAVQGLGGKYIPDCTVYVTLEPCPMCAGALAWARPARIVAGASDSKRGFMRFGLDMLHPRTMYQQGLFAAEAAALLQEFFREKRG
jgi:tRNA(adenine34) deaminase